MTSSLFDLKRFQEAQAGTYETALNELRHGRKQIHWMWFVFPQLKALGRSSTARQFGLSGASEAQAYWQHEVLGLRLKECCEALLAVEKLSAHQILGSPDDLKLCSCMTLFEVAVPDEPVFGRVLDRFYGGAKDGLTLELVQKQS